MRLRLLVGTALSVVTLLAGAVAAPAATAHAPTKEPVIVVHGWTGNAAGMAVMRDAFAAAGYPAYAIDLPGQNNKTNAEKIAELVASVRAQTGAAKVHLVAHSMGGLSARYYIKNLRGVDTVRTYVSMGTSHYGYWPACLLGEQDGGQMCPMNPFITDLDNGDDTPGDIAYSTFRSAREDAQITRLDGGACFAVPADVDHKDEVTTPAFIQAALTAVGGTCPGTFQTLPIT
jgi:triacylglycerol lipase